MTNVGHFDFTCPLTLSYRKNYFFPKATKLNIWLNQLSQLNVFDRAMLIGDYRTCNPTPSEGILNKVCQSL